MERIDWQRDRMYIILLYIIFAYFSIFYLSILYTYDKNLFPNVILSEHRNIIYHLPYSFYFSPYQRYPFFDNKLVVGPYV